MSVSAQTRPRLALPTFGWLTGYWELLRTLLRRELRARYKGSVLGIFWTLIYPLSMMGIYTLVFSVLWKAATDIPHYPLFVLCGLAVWTFFQASVQYGALSVVENGQLIKRVWFPRELVTVAAVLAQVVTALVMFAVLIPIALIVEPATARTVVLALPIFAALVCLALGFSWLLGTANVFFRDVGHLLAVVFLPWFFLTPVLYALERLPATAEHPWVVKVMRYGNPVTPYVESIRAVVLQNTIPGATMLAYVFLVGPVTALLGLWVVQRYEDRFAVEL
ncbi:MAG: ABC transporter permease [Actinomycetota bacterium]|nr:ABC transporter permease [Actinomycetota bacterium]